MDQWSLGGKTTPSSFTLADDQPFILKVLARKLQARFPDATVNSFLLNTVEAYQHFRDTIVPNQSHGWEIVVLDQARRRFSNSLVILKMSSHTICICYFEIGCPLFWGGKHRTLNLMYWHAFFHVCSDTQPWHPTKLGVAITRACLGVPCAHARRTSTWAAVQYWRERTLSLRSVDRPSRAASLFTVQTTRYVVSPQIGGT